MAVRDKNKETVEYTMKVSILQIYKEIIFDLFTGEKDLKIKEHPLRGVYVQDLSSEQFEDLESFYDLLQEAQNNRFVAGTKLNQYSSRSHTLFILELSQIHKTENIEKKGILNLVDLAGSEKLSKTGAVGNTLQEAIKINSSLSALGNVIHALSSGNDFIPYRDSKLTRLLQESLGGNYKTSLIVTCSPHSYNVEETITSLKFAKRAKTIKNTAKINIKLSEEELLRTIRLLENKINMLLAENERLRNTGVLNIDEKAAVDDNKAKIDEMSWDKEALSTFIKRNSIIDKLINIDSIIPQTTDNINNTTTSNLEIIESNKHLNAYDTYETARSLINNINTKMNNIHITAEEKENYENKIKILQMEILDQKEDITSLKEEIAELKNKHEKNELIKDLPIKELIMKLTNEINALNTKFTEEKSQSFERETIEDFIQKFNSTIDLLVGDNLVGKVTKESSVGKANFGLSLKDQINKKFKVFINYNNNNI